MTVMSHEKSQLLILILEYCKNVGTAYNLQGTPGH